MPRIPPYTTEEKIEGLKNTIHHLYGEIEKVEKQNKNLKEEIEMIKSCLIKKEVRIDKIYIITENYMIGSLCDSAEIWGNKYFQTKEMADKQCEELNKNATKTPYLYEVEELEVKDVK